MAMDASMLHAIRDEGYAGGVVFEWADEWFKHTWNTMDYEPEARRPFWRNTFTNEEHFGLLSEDASTPAEALLDGRPDPWASAGSDRLLSSATGPVRVVDAHADEEYLWLRIQLARPRGWLQEPLTLGFDAAPGGNGGLPGHPGTMPEADVAVTIHGATATLVRSASLDPVLAQYGDAGGLGMPHIDAGALRAGSGIWTRPSLMLNRPYTVPTTGRLHPVETVDIATLPWGSGDPAAPGGDTRNLVDDDGATLELRIPWLLLGFADPSTHQVLIPHRGGRFTTATEPRIGVGVMAGATFHRAAAATWPGWSAATAGDRLKQGVDRLAAAFAAVGAAGPER
jgi:hypothetical protein